MRATRVLLYVSGGALLAQSVGAHGGLTEQPHRDVDVTLQNDSSGNPAIGACGVQWDESNNAYKVVGVLCLPDPPIAVLPGWNVIGSIDSNPGGLQLSAASTSQPLNHKPNFMCMKFTRGNEQNGRFDLVLRVRVIEGETVHYNQTFHARVFVYGGPLEITYHQKAHDEEVFIMHPDPGFDPPRPDKMYPWYCTDFDYNPFDHRDKKRFRPNEKTQPVNVFKARPEWTQPTEIKIWYSLSAPGVFLNPNNELSDLEAEIDPRATKGLPSATWALIAAEPNSTNEFQVTATYDYSPAESLPNPPAAGDITDKSGDYYAHHNPNSNGIKYACFVTHRPASLTPLGDPPNPFDFGGFPDYQARVDFLLLTDTLGQGMPGVWVQERWPEGVPSGFSVNVEGEHWWTRRAGNIPASHSVFGNHDFGDYGQHGVMGPDWLYILVEYWIDPIHGNPFSLEHEYYAGTTATSTSAVPAIFLVSFELKFYDDGSITHGPPGGTSCLQSLQLSFSRPVRSYPNTCTPATHNIHTELLQTPTRLWWRNSLRARVITSLSSLQ